MNSAQVGTVNDSAIPTVSTDRVDSAPLVRSDHPEGLLLIERDSWQINAANAMALTWLDYDPPALLAYTLDEIILCDRLILQNLIRTVCEQGGWGPGVLTYRQADGTAIDLTTSASLLSYVGDPVISWILRPSDDLARSTREPVDVRFEGTVLDSLNRLKDDFLSSISHELRTPIANIKMATQMLTITLDRLGLLDPETTSAAKLHHYIQILQDESNREINLITDLLDIQHLETDTHRLAVQAIQLDAYLQRIAQPFHDQACKRSQHFGLEIEPNLPVLYSDAQHLERALMELLTNACKYTPDHETIRLWARMQSLPDTPEPRLLITIYNSGIEIPRSQLSHVFDKFYRVPHRDPHQYRGTGLGLALVQRIIQRLGGKVWAESGAGQTWFTIDLPLSSP